MADDFAGAAAMANHLAALQQTHIAHLTGPKYAPAVQQRARGLTSTLEEHGLRLSSEICYGTWSQQWARQATRALLAADPATDAIVCGSDQLAAAVLEVVVATSRKVPDDVAITGYDNWAVFAEETDPALTTVDMELEHLGAAAVGDLFAMIGGARVGGATRYHEGSLVVGGSTGANAGNRQATPCCDALGTRA